MLACYSIDAKNGGVGSRSLEAEQSPFWGSPRQMERFLFDDLSVVKKISHRHLYMLSALDREKVNKHDVVSIQLHISP
jgi:hypothetical protein